MKAPTNVKDDPNLKIPAAVLAQVKQGQQMFDTYRDSNLDENGQPLPLQVTDEPVVQDDLGAADLTGQPVLAAEPVKDDPATPADDESWEHKYKSLHGRFLRQSEAIKSLSEEGQSLRSMMATLQVAPSRAEETFSVTTDPDDVITTEEASDYGEDFLKLVGKKARQELAPITKAYESRIAELTKRLDGFTGFVQQDAHSKLMANLDSGLPTWREQNNDQKFIDWLSLPDPYSGAMRHDMLKAAYAQGNAPRVLNFFNGFLAEEAAVDPVKAEPDSTTTRVAKVPLKDLAAPGRAKTAASTQAPAEKPIFTRAQIAAFYSDVANGAYRGKDADKNKFEASIFLAQNEGRIR